MSVAVNPAMLHLAKVPRIAATNGMGEHGGGQMQINWPVGSLLEATNLAGPWITNGAVSPYTFTPTGSQKFFCVIVQ